MTKRIRFRRTIQRKLKVTWTLTCSCGRKRIVRRGQTIHCACGRTYRC